MEAFEGAPERPLDAPLDDFGNVMDLLGEYQDATEGETAMALWLVGGWWPEVRSRWAGQEFPGSWRPLFHDIFGNPFRPLPSLEAKWLRWQDGIIRNLAKQMYDSQDFSSMAILADALEEAGCTDRTILNHCRGLGPHVRGCWVLDLVLNKE